VVADRAPAASPRRAGEACRIVPGRSMIRGAPSTSRSAQFRDSPRCARKQCSRDCSRRWLPHLEIDSGFFNSVPNLIIFI
jgi:hypothetical protein